MTDLLIRERPMLFSAAMVLAILAGTKAQTRRVVKPGAGMQAGWLKPETLNLSPSAEISSGGIGRFGAQFEHPGGGPLTFIYCPYGQPGDRLYVRETFYAYGQWVKRLKEDDPTATEWHFIDRTLELGLSYQYDEILGWQKPKRADGLLAWHKRPAIHMPRVASRILLEITDVRVERLCSISEDDAVAEGIETWLEDMGAGYLRYYRDYLDSEGGWEKPKMSYESLWRKINGLDSWDKNEWVWVVCFKVVQPNV